MTSPDSDLDQAAASDPDLAALGSLTANLVAAVERIGESDWTVATPCPDWDLSGLIDHVTGGNWFTCRLLAGHAAEDAMTHAIERFADGSASREQASTSLSEQLDAFAQPTALDRTWDHISGEMTGRQILRLRMQDLIVHGWDIEESIAPPASIPQDLVSWGLAELGAQGSQTAELFGLSEVAAALTAANPVDGYLGAFGRTRSN